MESWTICFTFEISLVSYSVLIITNTGNGLGLVPLNHLTLFHPGYFIPGRCRFCPPCLIFLICGFLGFWWNHLQTVHDCRSHAKGDSQKFKIEDFIAIWKKILNFLKKSCHDRKVQNSVTYKLLNSFFCKHTHFISIQLFCGIRPPPHERVLINMHTTCNHFRPCGWLLPHYLILLLILVRDLS